MGIAEAVGSNVVRKMHQVGRKRMDEPWQVGLFSPMPDWNVGGDELDVWAVNETIEIVLRVAYCVLRGSCCVVYQQQEFAIEFGGERQSQVVDIAPDAGEMVLNGAGVEEDAHGVNHSRSVHKPARCHARFAR